MQNSNKSLKSVTALGDLNKVTVMFLCIYFYLEPMALDHNYKEFTKKFVKKITTGYN
jgi:hypothetical protein